MSEVKHDRATPEIVPPRSNATVLIVDDDQAILDGAGDLLTEEGFTVVPASNGAEALSLLHSGLRANVILLDVMMPVMDGWDFRAAQLDDPALRDIPVIVISASGFGRETIREQLKAREVLPKPLEPDEFLQTVKDACRATGFEGSSISGR